MTLTVVNSYQTTPAGSGTDGDSLLVTGTGIIAYDGDAAIFMSGDNQTTTIFGEVYSSTGRAILSQGLNAKVYVAEGGNVSGTTAIQTGDNGYIQNAGTLQGQVYMPSGTLQNTGTIFGYVSIRGTGSIVNYGDLLAYTQIDSSDPAQSFSVYNSGHIQSFDSRDFNTNFENHGQVDSFYCQNFLTLTNTGTISSLRFDSAGGSIINHGLIGGQTIYFSSGNDFYNGRDGVIEGAIRAGDGNDTIYTGAANDTIYGEGGNDTLDGGIGADTMDGGVGNDTYIVDNVGDLVTEFAASGTDTVQTSLTSYTLGTYVENLTFIDTGNFTGTGNALKNTIAGGAGNDTLSGMGGNDTLNGGAGADKLAGGIGNDTYIVDNVGDVVSEAAAAGTDTVKTTLAGYTLSANVENLIFIGSGNFAGTGNVLNNAITGGTSADALTGGGGNDTLKGLGGNDTLTGGSGNDNLTGGTGKDSFRFDAALNAVTNVDHIFDFSSVNDKILLSHSVFTQAGGLGTLAAGAFHIGAGAADADDRIIYDSAAGALIYDSNGNAAGGATPFATLATGLALTHSNFTIV